MVDDSSGELEQATAVGVAVDQLCGGCAVVRRDLSVDVVREGGDRQPGGVGWELSGG